MGKAPELMSDDERVHALDEADAELARLSTRRLRLIAALDQDGYAERVGARDTRQFLQYRYRLDHFRAHRDVQLARALPRYPVVSAQLAEVKLRPAQAEAIVLELEKTPSTVPAADLEVAERELSRLTHLSPCELRKATVQARDILDTDGPEPEERKAAARETLSLSSVDRGVKFKGYLANENAELLRSLITTGARPHKTLDGAPDPRPREKRQADALTTALTLAATALDTGTPSPAIPRPTTHTSTATPGTASGPVAAPGAGRGPADRELDVGAAEGAGPGRVGPEACGEVVPGFGAKANITVTIDLDDLRSATADAIGQTVYSNGLSAAAIRRLACDANLIPVVLGSKSEPLDVGRCERLVTKGMRRALNTRDRGCVVCGAPPVMCDAHHLIHWIDGGVTAVWNLALLCRRHHTDVHNGHWHVTITNDQVHVARPTWADPQPRPASHPPTESPPPSPGQPDVGEPPASNGNPDHPGNPCEPREPAEPRAATRRTVTDPRTDPQDEEAVRAATCMAIWGEPLPPDHHNKPGAEHRELTPSDPWHEPNTADCTPTASLSG